MFTNLTCHTVPQHSYSHTLHHKINCFSQPSLILGNQGHPFTRNEVKTSREKAEPWVLCKHSLFNIWLNSGFLITGRFLTHCTPMLLWQHKIHDSSSCECSQFPKCNSSFQVLIHRMINKVRWRFFRSHQTQFPVLDLKELLGHCKNKVHWSFNPSQTYCEFSKTAPFTDILLQVSEPCLFLAQRLGLQKVENPNRASFQQLLILTVTCLVSTVRDPANCRDNAQHCMAFTPGSLCPSEHQKPHTDLPAFRTKYPIFYIGSVKQMKYILLIVKEL